MPQTMANKLLSVDPILSPMQTLFLVLQEVIVLGLKTQDRQLHTAVELDNLISERNNKAATSRDGIVGDELNRERCKRKSAAMVSL